MQILYDPCGYYIEASSVLANEDPFVLQVKQARAKLEAPQIGSAMVRCRNGRRLKSLEEHHRHFSHMYGLQHPAQVLYEKRA